MRKIKDLVMKNKYFINTILLSILIFLGMLSFIVNINNFIPITTFLIFILLEICNFKKVKNVFKANKFTIIYFILLFVYILSLAGFLYCDLFTIKRVVYFFIICIPTAVSFRHKFKFNLLIKSILVLYAIFSIKYWFTSFGYYDASERMSISYYLLPLYISLIFDFYLNKTKKIKSLIFKIIIYFIVFFPYIIFLINYSSRGIILSIIICLFLLYIYNKKFKFKLLILISSIIITITLVYFSVPILETINAGLEKVDIKVEFVDKSLRLLKDNNFDSGRGILYFLALEDIGDKTLFGHGIGSFSKRYVKYPHNVVLQVFYEGGVIFGILIISILLYGIYYILIDQTKNNEHKQFLIFILSISLVKLMISYEFWYESLFWVFIFKVIDLLNNRLLEKGESNDYCNNTDL